MVFEKFQSYDGFEVNKISEPANSIKLKAGNLISVAITSICILSILFSIQFLRCWGEEFV